MGRLERRMETDRQQMSSQMQRVERRLEEFINASPSFGRMAELQGYVDGLGETVQGLVQRLEDLDTRAKPEAQASMAFESRVCAIENAHYQLETEFHLRCEKVGQLTCAPIGMCGMPCEVPGAADGHDPGADLREQVGSAFQEVAELRDDLGERVEQLDDFCTRLEEVELGLRGVAHAQEMQQENGRANEQVMRLALRAQRVQRSLGGAEEALELRLEVGHLAENVMSMGGRLQSLERGLDGVARAFDRVCNELSDLRARVDFSHEQDEASDLHAASNLQIPLSSNYVEDMRALQHRQDEGQWTARGRHDRQQLREHRH